MISLRIVGMRMILQVKEDKWSIDYGSELVEKTPFEGFQMNCR